MNCPTHGKTYLYKERLDNGKFVICCCGFKCEWKSEEVDIHAINEIPSNKEIKEIWH